MTSLRYLLFAALLVAAGCATTELPTRTDSELPSSEPFEGANIIHVITSESPQQARENIVSILRLRDYEISQGPEIDEDMIETEPRTFSQAAGAARYFVEIEEQNDSTRLSVYGRWIENQATDRHGFRQYPSHAVSARGQRRSTSWVAWQAMNDAVTSYRNGRILYDRQ